MGENVIKRKKKHPKQEAKQTNTTQLHHQQRIH